MTEILVAPASKSVTPGSYARLRNQVRQALLQGRKRAEALVEREKTSTYWKVGRLIDRHIKQEKRQESERLVYGRQTVAKLAKDIGTNQRFLYYALEFARTYPVLPARAKLEWRHYRALLSIEDERKRKSIAKEAEESGWSTRRLEAKVQEIQGRKDEKTRAARKKANTIQKFLPKRGSLHTNRILQSSAIREGRSTLLLDLGFSSYIELSPREAKGLKSGDIVRVIWSEDERRYQFKNKTKTFDGNDLYTYRAWVERVIDGDTLWVRINLGFRFQVRQKLRLRGIDCPELDTRAGGRAKHFVEEKLKPSPEIVITTTKPDKYDRYLTDIWIPSSPVILSPSLVILSEAKDLALRVNSAKNLDLESFINLNQLLLDSGHARLKTAVSPSDWGE